jgi:hypothetical protein
MDSKHVVSLDLAKKLSEAGFKNKTEFWWVNRIDIGEYRLINTREMILIEYREPCYSGNGTYVTNDIVNGFGLPHYPAPLATEILEELPPTMLMTQIKSSWMVSATDLQGAEGHQEIDKSLLDALVQMWLYLKKEGLIK